MVARSLPVRTPGALTPSVQTHGALQPAWRVALNLIGYQVGWLATLYGATHGLAWLGPVSVVALTAWYLALAEYPVRSLFLLVLALAIGMLVETALLRLGLVAYPTSPEGVPFWMLMLWPLFATTLSVGLRWFQSRLFTAALAGAVLGPLAYWAGAAAGAISLPGSEMSLLSLALVWMLAFPMLLQLAGRLERPQPEAS